MIKTFCNDVASIYTYCEPVAAIYTYCGQIWPTSSSLGLWYVKWQPSTMTGSFIMNGSVHDFQDYSGVYRWTGSGYVDNYAFLNKGISYMKTNVFSIGEGAFKSCNYLSSISLPNCKSIYNYGFYRCESLRGTSIINTQDNRWELYLPKCEYIGSSAFYRDHINVLNAPKCSYICDNAFYYNGHMTHILLPSCEYIGKSAFYSCSYIGDWQRPFSMSSFYLPICSYIDDYAFYNCSRLGYIELPSCKYIGNYAFYNTYAEWSLPECRYIGDYAFNINVISTSGGPAYMYLPKCEYIGVSAFGYWASTSMFILPVCSHIASQGLWELYYLRHLFLGSNTVCQIDDGYTIPVVSDTKIYVRSSLMSSYSVASYWSNYYRSSNIVPLGYTGSYKVYWTPANVSGSFKLMGINFNFSEFNGSYQTPIPVMGEETFKNTMISSASGNILNIWSNAFQSCSYLQSVNFSSCQTIGSNTFQGCSILSDINLPVCYSIGSWAFKDCMSIQTLNIPSASYIYEGAFQNTNLTQVNMNNVVSVYEDAFRDCTSLSQVSLPSCSSIGSDAFRGTIITSLTLPSCTDIYDSAFQGVGLVSVSLSRCQNIYSYAFKDCTSLSFVYIGDPRNIYDDVFYGCTNLSCLVLGYRGRRTFNLSTSYAFYGTSFWNGEGSIYIDSNVYSLYLSSSVWSYFSSLMISYPSGTRPWQ